MHPLTFSIILSALFCLTYVSGCSSSNSSNLAPMQSDGMHDGHVATADADRPDAGPDVPREPNYANPSRWLCHPERLDGPCYENLDVTQVNPDGSMEVIPHQTAERPEFDCFYVYPTCSADPAPNADLMADEHEPPVAHMQAARFQSMCRVFAPVYRQVTLGGLFARPDDADEDMAYGDVHDAFDHYMEHHNEGRGIVFIGHSQGALMLLRLLQAEFDDQPELREQLISAYLLGFTVEVPQGDTVGGDFQNIPLCTDADEIGCIVTYAAYRDTDPPRPDALFGFAQMPGMEAGCTDPGKLLGIEGPLDSILPRDVPSVFDPVVIGPRSPFSDPTAAPDLDTAFYSVPGLVSGSCVRMDENHFLNVTINGDPNDPRIDDILGDVVLPGWGLHLMDINIAMGQLESLMVRQSQVYSERSPRP